MGAGADVPDVVVAGGGLVGLAVAWRSAQRGLSVTVVDDAPGDGASLAAAGMLAPVSEASYGEQELTRLCVDSLARYPAFVGELEGTTGAAVGLRTAGTLVVGFDDDDVRALDALHAYRTELGLAAERLPGRSGRSRARSCAWAVRPGCSRAPSAPWSAAGRSTSSPTAATGWSSGPPWR